MMMMSAPSSSFHDYLPMDSTLTKLEAMSPVLNTEDYFEETFVEHSTNHHHNHHHNHQNHQHQHQHHHTNPRSNRNPVVKRPMNAFLLWARGERKRVSSDGYGVSQTSLSKLLGETWRHMSVEEKQPFLDMAETLKRQHHLDHPDYKFKPKQRSTATTATATSTSNSTTSSTNKSATKKMSSLNSQRSLNSIGSSPYCSSSSLSPMSNISSHPVQSNVLAMCQAIIPTPTSPTLISPSSSSTTTTMSNADGSSNEKNHDWFFHLTEQAQSVIVAPIPRHHQTSPNASRRAVRIQIINKHDDIALPTPTLLPMTPPPPVSSTTSSSSFGATAPSTIGFDDSTPTLVEYLVNSCNMFYIANNHQHQQGGFIHNLDDPTDYEPFHDPTVTQLTDLDQHDDSSGWIDTPLSSFGTNSTDLVSSSPYSSYDFLSL